MGLAEKIRGEFIDIIEWTQEDDSDTLAYRFPRYQHEIKMGAKLTVREGQVAVFVNEGKIADVFEPGMYELNTKNLPVLSTLKGWKYGFNSPFKADVYFIATNQMTDNKWGTGNPIVTRDNEFGMVRLRAYGSYVFRVGDASLLMRELVSTDPNFEVFEISNQMRQAIVSKFSDVLGNSDLSVLDLVGNYSQLGEYVLNQAQEDFASWGIELTKFYVENISLPEEVEKALDRKTSMGIVGDLDQYQKFQTAEAMRDAANQQGGGAAGMGAGLGAGMVMANQMMGSAVNPMQQQQQAPGQQQAQPQQQQAAPPPMPQFHVAINGQAAGPYDMAMLQRMVQNGQLTQSTLVWRQGLDNWVQASEMSELSSLFGSTPPPVPGE